MTTILPPIAERWAQVVGAAQVILFASGDLRDDAQRVAALRAAFNRHGFGDVFPGCPCCGERPWCPAELAAAHADAEAAPEVTLR